MAGRPRYYCDYLRAVFSLRVLGSLPRLTLFHFLGTQKSVRDTSALSGSVKNLRVALHTKGISRVGREMNLNPPEGLWRCMREGWERGVMRLGWETRGKKSLDNFNNFGGGRIASAVEQGFQVSERAWSCLI